MRGERVGPRSFGICPVPCTRKLSIRERSRSTLHKRLQVRGSTWNGFKTKAYCYTIMSTKDSSVNEAQTRPPTSSQTIRLPEGQIFWQVLHRRLNCRFLTRTHCAAIRFDVCSLLYGALAPLCAKQTQTRFISSPLTSVAVFTAQISACVSEVCNSIRLHDIGCFFRNTRLSRILTRYGQRPHSSLNLGGCLCSGTIPCVQVLVLAARVWQKAV